MLQIRRAVAWSTSFSSSSTAPNPEDDGPRKKSSQGQFSGASGAPRGVPGRGHVRARGPTICSDRRCSSFASSCPPRCPPRPGVRGFCCGGGIGGSRPSRDRALYLRDLSPSNAHDIRASWISPVSILTADAMTYPATWTAPDGCNSSSQCRATCPAAN